MEMERRGEERANFNKLISTNFNKLIANREGGKR
jgi:hypothetical protein